MPALSVNSILCPDRSLSAAPLNAKVPARSVCVVRARVAPVVVVPDNERVTPENASLSPASCTPSPSESVQTFPLMAPVPVLYFIRNVLEGIWVPVPIAF